MIWLVDSLDRLAGFPPPVRHSLGFALYLAQIGQKDESAKMLHGFGETVWQVRAYVLHAFQKKAKSGIATPQRDMDLIRQRLKLARKVAAGKGD